MSPTTLGLAASVAEHKSLWQGIGWRRRRRRTSVEDAAFHMLRLRRAAAEAQLRSIDQTSLPSEAQKQIWCEIHDLLDSASQTRADDLELDWDGVYKAEKLICLLYSGARLRQEIQPRLQQLVVEQIPSAERLRSEYQNLVVVERNSRDVSMDEATLHAFVLRVMDAIHECARKKNLARPLRKEATRNILFGVLAAFTLMVLPYLAVNWGEKGDLIGKWWSLFALYTALTAGALGAFFSRLISLQRQWASMSLDDVFLHRDFLYTLLRAGVGVCGALIAYFFLRSGIITGALFPDFANVAINFVVIPGPELVPMSFVMPSKDLALLTFWCFIAGFSEALVPSILANTERQFVEASAPPSRRPR